MPPILTWFRLDDIARLSSFMVVMVVGDDKFVRLLDSGPIRCPLFRRSSVLDDGRNIYRFLARIYVHIFFEKRTVKKSIEALNGEGAVRFIFRHVSFARWVRITKWRFILSTRGFEHLKTKIFAICFTFPRLFWRVALSFSGFLIFR